MPATPSPTTLQAPLSPYGFVSSSPMQQQTTASLPPPPLPLGGNTVASQSYFPRLRFGIRHGMVHVTDPIYEVGAPHAFWFLRARNGAWESRSMERHDPSGRFVSTSIVLYHHHYGGDDGGGGVAIRGIAVGDATQQQRMMRRRRHTLQSPLKTSIRVESGHILFIDAQDYPIDLDVHEEWFDRHFLTQDVSFIPSTTGPFDNAGYLIHTDRNGVFPMTLWFDADGHLVAVRIDDLFRREVGIEEEEEF